MLKAARIVTLVLVSMSLCAVSFATYVSCPGNSAIAAHSSATLIEGGEYDGWYKYTIEMKWSFDRWPGLSAWGIILKPGCCAPDHLIEFDQWAGYSTSRRHPDDPDALGWSGYFVKHNGDNGECFDTHCCGTDCRELCGVAFGRPYNVKCDLPGKTGHGTFSFYSNIIPEYGRYQNKVVGVNGICGGLVRGDLRGAYPSCTIVPEPATMAIMVMGLATVVIRRRRS